MPAIAQAPTKISFLTWNIIDQEELIKGWITRFQSSRPGVEVEWLDKKGPELPPFYQTQLAAGTPPDVINTQGALGLEYAAQGALLDLTPYLDKEPSGRAKFNADYLSNWSLEDKNYMLPFYITKTLLFYNKPMFQKAGLSGPPQSFDELLDAAQKMTGGDASGFLTLNFDWLYWPLYAMNGVDLPHQGPEEAGLQHGRRRPRDRAAGPGDAKRGDQQDLLDGALGRAERRVRRRQRRHAARPFAGLFLRQGAGQLGHARDARRRAHAGRLRDPELATASASPRARKNPDLAWDFLKFVTDEGQAGELATRRKLVTGNVAVDTKSLAELQKSDPLVHAILKTQLENTDKMVGNWRLGNDSRIKEAFWPELQNVLLGRKDAKAALADAERKIGRELARA